MSITHVELENIGPFEHLDLTLDRCWNIFLGDNGVGKSVILKAIAVGICGENVGPYIDTLIKAGKARASICLQMDGNRYLTEILRTERGTAIHSSSPSPIEEESWLALGFSSIWAKTPHLSRGPRRHTQGQQSTITDLLPLITGQPDQRFEEVNQMIINLDYAMRADPSTGGYDVSYRHHLTELFEIFSDLAEGQQIVFDHVDARTMTVYVKTADGVIPIDVISQGTAVLFGMAGILLQRLREVYAQALVVCHQPALVLIDEIDAHMHPAWQRTITGTFQKIFPNIQFIVSTHSPLIAGAANTSQIFLMRRDLQQSVVVERPELDMRGASADDILTSPLFGLESTIDVYTQALIGRYTELATREQLTTAEEREFDDISQALNLRIPSQAERREARDALEMIRSVYHQKLQAMTGEDRGKLLDAVKAQILESISGITIPR